MKVKAQIDRFIGKDNRIKAYAQRNPRRRICDQGYCRYGQQKRSVRKNALPVI